MKMINFRVPMKLVNKARLLFEGFKICNCSCSFLLCKYRALQIEVNVCMHNNSVWIFI
jgi:hypothetical protein